MSDSAVLIAVADAVTAEIAEAVAAGQFEGLEFTPVRSYADWERELDDFDTLHVDVVPFNYDDSNLKTRGTIGYLCSSSIVIRKRFGNTHRDQCGEIAPAEVDRLILLVQELHELFIGRRLGSLPEAAWEKTQIIAAYDYDLLRGPGMFAGVLRVTYDAPKELP